MGVKANRSVFLQKSQFDFSSHPWHLLILGVALHEIICNTEHKTKIDCMVFIVRCVPRFVSLRFFIMDFVFFCIPTSRMLDENANVACLHENCELTVLYMMTIAIYSGFC